MKRQSILAEAVSPLSHTGTLISAKGLSKTYGSLRALDQVDFSVSQGEAVGVVGPNGAGKTTLFGALAGTFPVSSGKIIYRGQDITYSAADTRCSLGIARTYQVPRPFLGLTVFENALVAAQANRRGSSASVERVGEILEKTGLLPLANSPASEIGLLDRKRLELARALATGPDLLLLDEIGGGLTEGELVQLIELISTLHQDGITIVWIEHILHALLQVVGRLVCMAEGRVLAQGDPQEVMENAEVRSAYLGNDLASDLNSELGGSSGDLAHASGSDPQ